jgi:asparagine synthase (glutamine-hydrolysing)
MGMAAGVEVREPFLDHPLVEWANALPVDVKLAGGVRKALLKEMAAPYLPQAIIHRAKVGFAMPTAEWFGPGGPLAARRQALLEPSSVVAEVTERAALEAVLDAHARHGAHRHLVWALVALDTWARVFLGPSLRRARLPGAPA